MPKIDQTIPEDALEAARKNTQQLLDQVDGQLPRSTPLAEPAQPVAPDPAAQPAPQPQIQKVQVGTNTGGQVVIRIAVPTPELRFTVEDARRLANLIREAAKTAKFAPMRR